MTLDVRSRNLLLLDCHRQRVPGIFIRFSNFIKILQVPKPKSQYKTKIELKIKT